MNVELAEYQIGSTVELANLGFSDSHWAGSFWREKLIVLSIFTNSRGGFTVAVEKLNGDIGCFDASDLTIVKSSKEKALDAIMELDSSCSTREFLSKLYDGGYLNKGEMDVIIEG